MHEHSLKESWLFSRSLGAVNNSAVQGKISNHPCNITIRVCACAYVRVNIYYGLLVYPIIKM